MKVLILCLLAASAMGIPFRRHSPMQGRIVGGSEASSMSEFPFQVSFQEGTIEGQYGFAFCGGSLLNESFVITAAHCVAGEDFTSPDDLQIVAGVLDFSVSADLNSDTVRTVVRIYQHNGYSRLTFENDIALLQLDRPYVFTSTIDQVDLPSQGQGSSGDGRVSGWGTTSSGGSTPDKLRYVDVPILTDEQCRSNQTRYDESNILDSMICAGQLGVGGVDSCQGDSGGPLTCLDAESNRYQCGVVSWGYGCAEADAPGVYTEVSYFVDWIGDNSDK